MIETSPAFAQAVVAETRRVLVKAVVDIISPDIVYGTATASGAWPTSDLSQLHDKESAGDHPYASLETNRWVLDGSMDVYDSSEALKGQHGWEGNVLSGDDGTFEAAPWVQMNFSGVTILQACSLVFSDLPLDGVPEEFTVEVVTAGGVGWSQTVTGNHATSVAFTGFTVQNPTGIRVTVHKMDLPGRVPRILEIFAGIYETWTNDDVVSLQAKQQGDPTCLSLPYGTMTLAMDNSTRRFDPGRKAGLFQSLEDRQGIAVMVGLRLPDGSAEYVPVGVYYQFDGGWKTGNNDLSMSWSMVDIIGLVTSRAYMVPSPLPTTLEGWVASVVAHLGVNFADRYTVDPAVAEAAVTVNSADDLANLRCGDVLRYACMAAGAWPRAGNANGNLLVEPMKDAGTELTLDNLSAYPTIQANADLASILFTLYQSGGTVQYVVAGNQPSAAKTVNVNNPFLHTTAQADAAAAAILTGYGGNQIKTTGRGDPASEVGDLDTVDINREGAVTGRRIYQTLNLQNGVLAGCQSTFLAPDSAMAD